MNIATVPEISDTDLVRSFLAATANLSQDEAAACAEGVLQNDVSRWRRGDWKRLSAKKRRALLAFLGEQQREVVEDGDLLDEWVRDFERRVRNVGGKDERMSDYERRERKGDAIEAQIQALQQIGEPVPARLYELREMWRRGEL